MPPGRRPQDQNYPFTKRCTDAAITLIEPDRDWFTDRGLEFPRPKKERVEIFAAHAWAFASCDFHDAGAAAAAWNSLPPPERDFLFSMCRHPLPRLRESPVQLTMRLLQNFRPRPPTPPAGAAAFSPPASPEIAGLGSATFPAAGAHGDGGPSARAGAPTSATSGAARPVEDLSDPVFAEKVRKLFSSLSPASTARFLRGDAAGASLSAGASAPAGANTPTPTPGATPARPGGSSARRRLVAPSPRDDRLRGPTPALTITYGNLRDRLGVHLDGRFNVTGGKDWTRKERETFQREGSTIVINSSAAAAFGWLVKPPYSLLENLLMPPPPGSEPVDESTRLGERLARVGHYRDSDADPLDLGSDASSRLARVVDFWRDYCRVSLENPLAASSRLAGLKQITRAHFAERQEDLCVALPEMNLGELVPIIREQSADLDELFQRQETRVGNMRRGSEEDRATTANTEWMNFFHPFFQAVYSVDGAATTPAQAAAARAMAAAALPPGSVCLPPPPPAPAATYPPPPQYYPPPAAHAPVPPQPPPPKAPAHHQGAGAPPTTLGAAFGQVASAIASARPPPINLPCSAEIIGVKLAVWSAVPAHLTCRACSGCAHAHFECPIRYFARLGTPCPGFDATGARLPNSWNGNDITRATRADWKSFAARFSLTQGRSVPAAPAF